MNQLFLFEETFAFWRAF